MTSVKIVDLCEAFALNVKNEIDRVQPEIKKPEAQTSGHNKLGEPDTEPRRTSYAPILSGSPKSYNTLGATMNIDFIVLSPFIIHTDAWKNLSSHQINILMTLIHNCVRDDYIFDIHGEKINLRRAQVCTTVRKLGEMCPRDSKKNSVTKQMVETALKKFEFLGWISIEIVGMSKNQNPNSRQAARQTARQTSRQTARHKKTVITLNDSIIYDSRKVLNKTNSKTNSSQVKDINIASISSKSIPIPDSNYLNASLGGCGNVHNSASTPAEIYFDRERKKLMNIYEEDFQRWEAMFPNVNVRAEIALLCEDEAKKPSRKSHTSWERRIISWLKKANPIQQNLVDKKEEEDIELRIQKNRENTLKELKLWNIKKASVEAYNQHVEFVIGTMKTEVVKYEEKNFWTIFKSKLLQYGEKKV